MKAGLIAIYAYGLGVLITFVFLTFFDGYKYTWWNWWLALGVNGLLGAMWPIYWGLLRWVVPT